MQIGKYQVQLHDIREFAILGEAILNQMRWEEIAHLKPEDWQSVEARSIFQIMKRSSSNNPHPTVSAILHEMTSEEQEKLGFDPILSCPDYAIACNNIEMKYFYDEVERQRIKKVGAKLIKLAEQSTTRKKEEDIQISASSLISLSQKILEDSLLERPNEDRSIQAATQATIKYLEQIIAKTKRPLLTQLNRLNTFIQLLGGKLVVLGARPGQGKTALSLQLANDFSGSKHGKKINQARGYIASAEMLKEELILRFVSQETSIPYEDITIIKINKEQLSLVFNAINDISTWDIVIDDDCNKVDIDVLCSRIRKAHHKSKLHYVIVDYAQIIKPPDFLNSATKERIVSYISASLVDLSKELNIPVILLSQLNREIEKRKGKEVTPVMSDLKDAGSLEQDAHIVMFLHKEPNKTKGQKEEGILVIGKNRGGRTGSIPYLFDGGTMTIKES